MKPPAVEYVRASSTGEAIALLSENGIDAKLLAGGQSLIPLMSFRLARPTILIDINRIPGLDAITAGNGHLAIGAMARQRTIERDPLVAAAVPLLPAVLRYVGHVTNRNRGTIGGSIAHADPAAELPAVLTALGGEVVVEGAAGSRTISAENFFLGSFTTALDHDEILTAVKLPQLPAGTGLGVEELARRHGDFAIVAAFVAIHLDADDRIDLVRVAASSVDSVPLRLYGCESALIGSRPTKALIDAAAAEVSAAVHPLEDIHAPAEYRRDMAVVLVRRAIHTAVAHAKKGGS